MCGSTVDIQSATAEISRGKKEKKKKRKKKKKPQDEHIMACPIGRPKLEAKDVLPNINRTQAAERAEKCRFCIPGDLDLWS